MFQISYILQLQGYGIQHEFRKDSLVEGHNWSGSLSQHGPLAVGII